MGRGLYRSSAIAIAADGTIFVLDNGNHRVVAFDQSGDALREFGREGQGPGEFQNPLGFGVAGNRVLISDIGNNRLTIFSTDGDHVADTQFDDRFWARAITAIDDELMMIIAPNLRFTARDEPYPVSWVLARYSVSGEQRAVLAEREASTKAFYYSAEMVGRVPMVFANPIGAFGPGAVTHVTSGDHYQILSIGPDGAARWALRAAFTPETPTEEQKDEMLAQYRRFAERPGFAAEMASARFVWPERFAALENIETDARGNLYVFPYTFRPPDSEPGPDLPVAVDVYSPEGLSLFAGMSEINHWDAVFDNYIFRLEDDSDTGERIVVRYRILSKLE